MRMIRYFLFICSILLVSQAGFAQYQVKVLCDTQEALEQFADRVSVNNGRSHIRYQNGPSLGSPEFFQYIKNKKCFRHAPMPTSKTEVSELVYTGEKRIADRHDGTLWKIEFFEATVQRVSGPQRIFIMSPPCPAKGRCLDQVKDATPNPLRACTKWPMPYKGSSQRMAFTGWKIGYRFFLDCKLTGRFQTSGFEGRWSSEALAEFGTLGLQPLVLAAGFTLYRIIAEIPEDQTPGIYHFDGCLRVQDTIYKQERCLPIPSPVPNHGLEIVPED